jgi:hypothetical protein
MDKQARDKILDTVRKLAQMANPENGAFPQEIATASAKMQTLMDAYNISMSEVLFEEQNKNGHKQSFVSATSKGMLGSLKRWHWQLARCIAKITGTKYYATGGRGATLRWKTRSDIRGHHMSFFGIGKACTLAAELFDEWVVLIDDMGKKATAEYIKEMETWDWVKKQMASKGVKQVRHLRYLEEEHPNVWRNSWLEGVASGIMASLLEQEKERTTQTSTALMVVSKAVEVAYKDYSSNFRRMGGGSSGKNYGAFNSGHAVGKTLRIGSKRIT